jgi:hypothetical protein
VVVSLDPDVWLVVSRLRSSVDPRVSVVERTLERLRSTSAPPRTVVRLRMDTLGSSVCTVVRRRRIETLGSSCCTATRLRRRTVTLVGGFFLRTATFLRWDLVTTVGSSRSSVTAARRRRTVTLGASSVWRTVVRLRRSTETSVLSRLRVPPLSSRVRVVVRSSPWPEPPRVVARSSR